MQKAPGAPLAGEHTYVPLEALRRLYAKEQLEEANVEEILFQDLMQMQSITSVEVAQFRDTGYLVVKQVLTESQCRIIERRVVEVWFPSLPTPNPN
jgi:hypothetical protein